MTRNPLLRLRQAMSHSLSTKLSLIILLLAVPVFAVSLGLLFIQSRYMIRQEAMGRVSSELATTMQVVCRHIASIEKATDACAVFASDNINPENLRNLTRYIVGVNSDIDGCSISMEPGVFPEYGRYFSVYSLRMVSLEETADSVRDSVVTVIERPYDYFGKTWYKSPREQGRPCWVDYYDESDTLEVTLKGLLASYNRPVFDPSGRIAGIISTDFSLARLSSQLLRQRPYPNSYFLMVDADGRFLVHPDSAMLFSHTIFEGLDPVRQPELIALAKDITGGGEGSAFAEVDGKHCLVTYMPVPGLTWHMALVCPDSDIMAAYHKQTYILVPLLLFGLLFIVVICHHAVTRSIRPLNELVEKTQAVAAGNMETHIPASKRTDAVGGLQNSFAAMLQNLNFHMGSVRYSTELAQQRNKELEETTRMAEEAEQQKTLFIQNVSHQIRTPLNIIMGFAQILSNARNAALTPEEFNDITGTMRHNSRLLCRMVLMLFDSSDTGFFEELGCNKHDKVFCNDALREMVDYIDFNFPAVSVSLHTELADDFFIYTNRLYMVRSLSELLYNAAKYSDGQHIMISASLKADGRSVCFVIDDTGSGISESDRDRMFTFFAKVDDLSEGLGLGLPLARRHILNLGGDLLLDADYHEGCRFVVELPCDGPQS